MKLQPKLLVTYKLFFGLLGFSAIVTEIAVLAQRGLFNGINFFSYFTIQTNILVVVAFLLSVIATAAGKKYRALDVLRAATTVYILVVGIGFAVLLSGLEGVALTAVPWDNLVLHYIIPGAVLLDFIIDRPHTLIRFKTGLVWVLYPLAYVAYSLIRGESTGWYPYPFLNPNVSSYGSIAATVAGLTFLGIMLILFTTRLTRRP
jgi:hypothetical protein